MYKDILLTIDLDQKASWEKALPVALEYADTFGARLHLMTVVPPFGMSIVGQFFPSDYEKQVLDAAMAALKDFDAKNIDQGRRVQHIVAQGTVYEEIIDSAQKINADLIIIAAHGPRMQDYFLGPNAARVVRHSDRSVLVVR